MNEDISNKKKVGFSSSVTKSVFGWINWKFWEN